MPAFVVPGSQNRDRGAPHVVVSFNTEEPGYPTQEPAVAGIFWILCLATMVLSENL